MNVHKIKDENLNETLESVFKNIESSAQGADSEKNFKGLFDDIDVNSNKLGGTVSQRNDRLVKPPEWHCQHEAWKLPR